MTDPTPERIAEIRANMERCPEAWTQQAWDLLAAVDALTAERDEARAQVARMRSALEQCSGLFAEICGDWTDPRYECREGCEIIHAALSPDAGKAWAARLKAAEAVVEAVRLARGIGSTLPQVVDLVLAYDHARKATEEWEP